MESITRDLKENPIYIQFLKQDYLHLPISFNTKDKQTVQISVNDFIRWEFELQLGILLTHLYLKYGILIRLVVSNIEEINYYYYRIDYTDEFKQPVGHGVFNYMIDEYEGVTNPFQAYKDAIIAIFTKVECPF